MQSEFPSNSIQRCGRVNQSHRLTDRRAQVYIRNNPLSAQSNIAARVSPPRRTGWIRAPVLAWRSSARSNVQFSCVFRRGSVGASSCRPLQLFSLASRTAPLPAATLFSIYLNWSFSVGDPKAVLRPSRGLRRGLCRPAEHQAAAVCFMYIRRVQVSGGLSTFEVFRGRYPHDTAETVPGPEHLLTAFVDRLVIPRMVAGRRGRDHHLGSPAISWLLCGMRKEIRSRSRRIRCDFP